MPITKALLAGAFLAVATSGLAFAGFKVSQPVTVDTVERFAFGSLGSARNSADSVQYIGCYLTMSSNLTQPTGTCVAVSAANVFGLCTSSVPGFVATMQHMASDSKIYFSWDATGKCTTLQIFKSSEYEPKK